MDAVTILKLDIPCSVRGAHQFPTASRFVCGPIEVRYPEGTGPSMTLRVARGVPQSARRYRAGVMRRVRMDFECYRQSEPAEQAQRLRRQVQSEILADKQTDMKLCYASTATELLQEFV
jgi:hypothetical protein